MSSRVAARFIPALSYRHVRGTVALLRTLLDEVERLVPASSEAGEGDAQLRAVMGQSAEELARLGMTLLSLASGLVGASGVSGEEQGEGEATLGSDAVKA